MASEFEWPIKRDDVPVPDGNLLIVNGRNITGVTLHGRKFDNIGDGRWQLILRDGEDWAAIKIETEPPLR